MPQNVSLIDFKITVKNAFNIPEESLDRILIMSNGKVLTRDHLSLLHNGLSPQDEIEVIVAKVRHPSQSALGDITPVGMAHR